MISRVHAHIAHLSNNQWKLRDNRSVNGVYVNDVKVSEASLNDGDVITFGGGGNAPFGSKKQQPDSEFIYKFTGTFIAFHAAHIQVNRSLFERSYSPRLCFPFLT
jgi:pSer/pThr/pTyr-binding forkhead associated (FHA) protein